MDNYRDFLVGLLLLVTLGIVLGLLIVTSNLLDDPQEIYMRTASANGLTEDTKVLMQGLQVGRLDEINPQVSPEGLVFIAHLHLRKTYPDGTPLQIPAGTRAIIAESNPIAGAEVRLEFPSRPGGGRFLQPGDTIDADRLPGAVSLLGEVALELKDQVLQTLQQTRALMEQGTETIARTQAVITSTNNLFGTTAPRVDEALQTLASTLERAEEILNQIAPRIGPLQDSLAATLAQARSILGNFDTLATTAHLVLSENRETVRLALEQLTSTTRTLDHFAREVSRRPTRLLTGVEPPPPDTTLTRR